MLTNLQKNDFLNTIFDRIPADAKPEEALNEIRDILLADTKKGKLYKFRAINDYSLSNLLEGTMYCAIPSSFNDPFDCKMGMDVQSSITANLEKESENVADYLVKFIHIQSGILSMDECSEHEKVVLERWSSNAKFSQFVKELVEKDYNENEVREMIFSNFDIISTLFTGFISDEMINKGMKDAETMFPTIVKGASPEMIEQFKKNASLLSLAQMMGIEDDADETSILLKMVAKQNLEYADIAKKLNTDFSRISRELGESIDREYRIVSLCTDYKNRLMWSHYADGHKGFCIEYDFEEDTRIFETALLLPVVYSKERVKFPWNVIYAEDKEAPEIKSAGAYAKLRSLLVKDEIWEYEHEWRLIVLRKSGIENIKMPPVSCIYVGAMCSDKNRKMLRRIAKELNVPIKQMVVDRGEFLLHAGECKE